MFLFKAVVFSKRFCAWLSLAASFGFIRWQQPFVFSVSFLINF